MSEIKVITKDNASSQGKPRVYFSCHPADTDKYLAVICDDIWTTQNCAVYYEADWNMPADETELESRLNDMQLFVIPVTTQYIYHECRAMMFEYGFAIKNHIPILPIEMESGITHDFVDKMNQIGDGYGDVQLLNRTSSDLSEIPYSEKLKNRLENILVGDKMAERVRAAFDAYIFLSYRKKDRIYAKKLMKLIHRIPFCRDIAIWYDEYLVPGEDWSEAIAKALEKSKLVALAITPNITEEGNYVVNKEYPSAVKEGKEIMPAEMLPTDRDTLARMFGGLATPIDGNNQEAVEAALQQLAKKENDTDAEHNFLIGLAYLAGIDVERDSERAFNLIMSAAEGNCPEAMEKLVSMYDTGEGVSRDYYAAIDWQQRYVDYLKNHTNNIGSIIYELQQLGRMLKNVGKFQDAGKAISVMLSFTEKSDNEHDISVAHLELGDIYEGEGNIAKAEEEFLFCLKIAQKLAEEKNLPDDWEHLGVVYNRLGIICEDENKLSEAEHYYLKSQEIGYKTQSEADIAWNYRQRLAEYSKLGQICEKQGRISEAEKYYLKFLEYSQKYAVESKKSEANDFIALSYIYLGGLANNEGKILKARERYENALEVIKPTLTENNTLETRRNLLVVYNEMGRNYFLEGNLDTAEKYYLQSLDLAKKLENETGTIYELTNLSAALSNLGGICISKGDFGAAKEYFLEELETDKRNVSRAESVQSMTRLAVAYGNVGETLEKSGNVKEAEEYYCRKLEILENLDKGDKSFEVSFQKAKIYISLGDISGAQGEIEKARYNYNKSLDVSRKLAEDSDNKSAKSLLSGCLTKLGELFYLEEDYLKVKEYFLDALKNVENIAEESNDKDDIGQLLYIYTRLGLLYEGDGDVGKNYFLKGIDFAEKHLNNFVPFLQENLWTCYLHLGAICGNKGRFREAKEYFNKGLKSYENKDAYKEDIDYIRKCSEIYDVWISIFMDSNRILKAMHYLKKDMKLCKKIEENTHLPSDKLKLASMYYSWACCELIRSKIFSYSIYIALANKLLNELKTDFSDDSILMKEVKNLENNINKIAKKREN